MDTNIKIGVIVCGRDAQILLIKERFKKNDRALWNIIKGTHENGETLFETAIRECKEEAGIDVDLTHSLGVCISEEPDKMRIQFNFLAKATDTAVAVPILEEQASRNEFIEEVRWFAEEEITNMRAEDFISAQAFELIMNWIRNKKKFPLELYEHVHL